MPMQKNLYPPNWNTIAERRKAAADYTCEKCGARRGEERPNRRGEMKRVVITVAHLDHNPWARHARLAVLCSQCHLRYDAKQRRRQRTMMRIARGQLVLPGLRSWYQPPRRRAKDRMGILPPHGARRSTRRQALARAIQKEVMQT
jgi:hypothetical protein